MDPGEIIMIPSDTHSHADEDVKRPMAGDNSHNNHFFQYNDDYSDIYFDKSCINQDDMSLCNFSNFPKEIHLEDGNLSDDEMYGGANLPLSGFHKPISMSVRKSLGANHDSLDEEVPQSSRAKLELNLKVKGDQADPSMFPTSVEISRGEEPNKLEQGYSTSRINQNVELDYSPRLPSFMKNEGKLVFKITRFNKVTQKEKLITKNRRIISKCPHTSLKYYAKGMCKKCYHNFGREKKAFVCGHTEKPLYAKGFCKQCYLSKYKQKTNVKSEYRSTDNIRVHKHNQLSICSNANGFESLGIDHDMYFGRQNSVANM